LNSALIINTKRFLWTYCRPGFQVVRRWRKASHNRYDVWKSAQMGGILKAFVDHHGLVIQGGPFRGMKYTSDSMGSALMPKLVGSYEAEVQADLENYCRQAGAVNIVDIGCDEGYYAVGMARKLPSARVYAFDISTQAQQMCRQMAIMNGVEDKVIIGGECTPQVLNDLLRPGDLLICDCEGCEFSIVNPDLAPALKNVHMIVELHDSDYLELNITPTLIKRFEASHEIEIVTGSTRRAAEWPAVRFLKSDQQRLAIDEGRTLGQQWALMRPRSRYEALRTQA